MATTSNHLGLAAVLASVLIPAAQVFAPVVQQWNAAKLQTATNQAIEEDKHKEQLAELLINSYIGHTPKEQKAALVIMQGLFPEYFGPMSEALAGLAADSAVAAKVDIAKAQIDNVPESTLDVAQAAERSGFEALANGDLLIAKDHFAEAYAAYPTYHNVEEISTALKDVQPNDTAAVNKALRTIVAEHAWGMPKQYKQRILQRQ